MDASDAIIASPPPLLTTTSSVVITQQVSPSEAPAERTAAAAAVAAEAAAYCVTHGINTASINISVKPAVGVALRAIEQQQQQQQHTCCFSFHTPSAAPQCHVAVSADTKSQQPRLDDSSVLPLSDGGQPSLAGRKRPPPCGGCGVGSPGEAGALPHQDRAAAGASSRQIKKERAQEGEAPKPSACDFPRDGVVSMPITAVGGGPNSTAFVLPDRLIKEQDRDDGAWEGGVINVGGGYEAGRQEHLLGTSSLRAAVGESPVAVEGSALRPAGQVSCFGDFHFSVEVMVHLQQ